MSERLPLASGLAYCETDATNNARVESEVQTLATMPTVALRQHYRQLFRKEPPKAFGPDLLRRSISWRLQERACPRPRDACCAPPWPHDPTAGSNCPADRGGQTWNGKRYRVMVLAEGYAYDGTTFASLSERVNLITGTCWNGPRFFSLRQTKDTNIDGPPPPASLTQAVARADVTPPEPCPQALPPSTPTVTTSARTGRQQHGHRPSRQTVVALASPDE